MHDKLFDNQRSLDVASLKRYASEAGLDPAAFSACLDSGRQSAEVQKDVQEGNRVGVSGTPTVFVNGRMMPGAANPQALSEAIDEELALSGASERVSR